MSFDVLIKNGDVLDGSGGGPRRANIGIKAGRIAAVGNLTEASAADEIDAAGQLVTPGFIDAHAHSDVALYVNPGAETQVAQGITTEIMGNCGYSPFPLLANNRNYLLDPPGVDLPWSSAAEYINLMARGRLGINAVPQVGHITVRAAVLNREDRPARAAEIEQMKVHVRAAMEAGVRGFSTGLDYEPTTVSDLEEIVELAKVAAEYGGFYTSHIRGYSHNVINAAAEAVEVGRRAGTMVQISHLGVAGRKNWGFGSRLLAIMDKARHEGVPVACDMMAYPTAGAWWSARAIFPSWAYDWRKPWAESLETLREILRNPEQRAQLKAEIEIRRERPKHGFHEEFIIFSNWGDIYIHELPAASPRRYLLGMDMVSAAAAEGMDPCGLYFDLLLNEGEELAAVHSPIGPQDFRELLADDWTMFGTDAIGTSIRRLHEPWNPLQPHPRHYGTFPRVFAKFVLGEHLLDLAAAVRRMTGLAADHFGLEGRGYLREGYAADLVVLNLPQVEERGTWRVPPAYPDGISHVLVNGVEEVRHGQFTGARGGRLLTRGS